MDSQNTIQEAIKFYDTKTRSKRLLLVANTTDNNEYVCLPIVSARANQSVENLPGNVFVPKSAENGLKYDSYVKCNVEYIVATDSIYTEIQNTQIRLSQGEFSRVMARYEMLKAKNEVNRVHNTVEKKNEEFEKLKAQVVQTAEEYKRNPKLMAELVDFRSKFYNYSFHNSFLIYLQNKFSTFVASFQKWNDLGYRVNKGEKGIKILTPYEVTYYNKNGNWENVRNASRTELDRIYKNEIETTKRTYFTVGNVFDISQTNCPASNYPQFYDMGYASAGQAVLYESLKIFAVKSGFNVIEDAVNSIALKGFFSRDNNSITINNKLADSEKLATLSHEFAHALLHKTSTQSPELTEFEAECLSHMVQKRFSLPISEANKDYIATYYSKVKGDELELDKSFNRISKAFNHVAEGVDKELTAKGIDISHSLDLNQERNVSKLPAEKVNQNFLQDIE
jgi:hypothetical protein